MAQSGYTPILIYASGTTGNTPSASNLTSSSSGSELALNYYDGKLFYKDNTGTVQVIASKASNSGSFSSVAITGGSIDGTTIGSSTASTGAFTTLSASSTVSGTGFSTYLASPPAIGGTTAASGKFTTLTSTSDATLHGLTVGLGNSSISTNTALGVTALNSVTTGNGQTAVGYQSLYSVTTNTNDAFGYQSAKNTTGNGNASFGVQSLLNNTSGNYNTALGGNAMLGSAGSSTGSYNTALGSQALYSNTTASNNTAVGYQSGYSIVGGGDNTFVGRVAGYSATSGTFNCFIGDGAGYNVTTGGKNTILGSYNGNQGSLDIRTSSNYIVLSDGDGNPRMWNNGAGSWYAPDMYSNTTASASNMFVGSTGYVARSTSALKYKTNVRDLPAIDITKFRPIVYNSNCEGDDKTADHFGFIADEVDQAGYKQLVSYGAQGEVEGFQYERMTVVLTQQIQSLLATVNAQATTIATMQAQITALQAKVGA